MKETDIYSISETNEDKLGALRPECFDDYTGQKKVIENLKVYVKATKERGTALTTAFFMVHRSWKNYSCKYNSS